MKIIILGAGQVGRTAAYHLAREAGERSHRRRHQRRAAARPAGSHRHPHGRRQRARSPSVLEAAGARDADIFIALTNSDEVNMVACQIAWSLFNKDATRIARIRSADFTKHAKLFYDEDRAFAVDVPISPEQLVTDHVVRLIHYPGALQVLDFADGRVRLVGVQGAARRRAGRPAAQAARRRTSRAAMRASRRSIAAARASSRQATPSSSTATRCSSSPRAKTSAW